VLALAAEAAEEAVAEQIRLLVVVEVVEPVVPVDLFVPSHIN
jgi:hypothetical protein